MRERGENENKSFILPEGGSWWWEGEIVTTDNH